MIHCGDGVIALAGSDDWATLYAVGDLLERLGLRFYTIDYHTLTLPPKKPKSKIEAFHIIDRPAFIFRPLRDWRLRGSSIQRGDPHKGANPELFDPKKTNSDLWMDHTAGYLVPKELYYDEHPEYYAMLADGRRIPKNAFSHHRTPLCLSNSDVLRISTERALEWIEREREKRFFMITYGDTNLWCQCPFCRKLDPISGQYSTRLLYWVNHIARAVKKRYPDKILNTFAYGGSSAPPPSFARRRMCLFVRLRGLVTYASGVITSHRTPPPSGGM